MRVRCNRRGARNSRRAARPRAGHCVRSVELQPEHLTAARALDQINNQVRSLENQAQLLINGAKNLTSLPASVVGQLNSNIDEINRLIAQAKGISFEVERPSANSGCLSAREYTAGVSSDRMAQDATARRDKTTKRSNKRSSHRRRSRMRSDTTARRPNLDGGFLRRHRGLAGAAVGQRARRAPGKQSLQLQALVATQARADALKSAGEQASAEAARERFTRFIGDGHAYAGRR